MGHLTMSVTERERAKVLERVSRGEMTLKEGADITGVSYRQMKRLRKRFEKDGDQGKLSVRRREITHLFAYPPLRHNILSTEVLNEFDHSSGSARSQIAHRSLAQYPAVYSSGHAR